MPRQWRSWMQPTVGQMQLLCQSTRTGALQVRTATMSVGGAHCALTVGGADSFMNNILKVRKLTVKEARMLALQGGLCLSEHLTIMQTMTEHLAAVRGSEQRVVYPEVH